MSRAKAILAATLLAGCSPPDTTTPEGLAGHFIAEVRSEDWGGIFDLLSAEGRETLKQDLHRLFEEAKDPSESQRRLRELSMLPLRDVFIDFGKASTADPKFRERLRDHYGLATVAWVAGIEAAKQVSLNRKTGGTETIYLSLADGRWWLHRFPWDWRR